MTKIETLTPEQAAYLPKFRDEYFRHGTNCDPADRRRAERAFARAYRTIGKDRVPVIWVDSPLTAQLASAALKNLKFAGAEGAGSNFLRASLRASLWDSLGDSLWDSLGDSLRDSLWDSLGDSLGDSLWDSLRASLWDSLWDSLGDSKIPIEHTWFWGQHDLYWIAFYKFCQEIGVQFQPDAADKLDIDHEIGMSCMWFWPRDGVIIACERPKAVHFDERERLHNATGAAVEFRDGWKIYSVHGVSVPAWIIEQPELLNIKTIEAETNTEIQRVMIERFGWDRYAAECGATVIDHDERFGTLYGRNGAAQFVKVINGSPETDGTFRNYILPVAPSCEPLPDAGGELGAPQKPTALNAVASTYGLTGKEYANVLEVRT